MISACKNEDTRLEQAFNIELNMTLLQGYSILKLMKKSIQIIIIQVLKAATRHACRKHVNKPVKLVQRKPIPVWGNYVILYLPSKYSRDLQKRVNMN